MPEIPGMSDPNDTAVDFKFGDRTDLEQYLCTLSSNLNIYLSKGIHF